MNAPPQPDKRQGDLAFLRAWLADGMTIGIGGFGLDRKPMALVEAIAASAVRDLRIEVYAGGFDIEVLIGAGKVACVSACHVGLDQFGLAALFRSARETGATIFEEWTELSQLHAWRAAADGAPFAVVPMDANSELLRVNPALRIAPSPFDGRQWVHARAPAIDLALIHAEAAHPQGWAVTDGEPYLDALLARAAKRVVLSAERLMEDAELERRHGDVHLLAADIDAIIVAPGGALPGSCLPDYMIDFPACRAYCEACAAGGAPQIALGAALAHTPRIAGLEAGRR